MKHSFICGALLFLCFLPWSMAEAQPALRLESQPLHLNPEDKSQRSVGRLLWRGGIAVSARNPDFGGLSGLNLDADGVGFSAVSDEGRWLTGRLLYNQHGDLAGVAATGFGRLKDLRGLPLNRKRRQDAESLTRLADGGLLVGFERNHRLWRFPAGSGLDGRPSAFPVPPGLSRAGANSGAEALVALADGRLLVFTEGQAVGQDFAVYLWEDGKGWSLLTLKPAGLFRPTGAALLPDGDILLLERRFTVLGGLGMRLRRIEAAQVRPGALLDGEMIAELRPPLTVDNFEGIAVHEAGDGSLRATLISDDNFSPLQRTLIVQFELRIEG